MKLKLHKLWINTKIQSALLQPLKIKIKPGFKNGTILLDRILQQKQKSSHQ